MDLFQAARENHFGSQLPHFAEIGRNCREASQDEFVHVGFVVGNDAYVGACGKAGGGYLAGKNIVRDCMQDPAIRTFLEKTMFEEIIPTLDLPRDEVEGFAASVIDRFDNPYIDHQLLDIALNSASKWKARVMPSLTEFVKRQGKLPKRLTFSLAAFIAFYHKGERDGVEYAVRDDQWVLDFFAAHKADDNRTLAAAVVNDERLWDGALAKIEGLEAAVTAALDRIDEVGIYEAMKECAE